MMRNWPMRLLTPQAGAHRTLRNLLWERRTRLIWRRYS